MARSTYQAFAKVFSTYHEQYAAGPSSRQLDAPLRHDAVLDEEGGMLVSLMAAVERRSAAYCMLSRMVADVDSITSGGTGGMTDGDDPLTLDEQDALLLEHRTWQLVRAVYE